MSLGTIHSAAENNFLKDWAEDALKNVWIRLKKTGDGLWMWQDDGNLTYKNWQEKYPTGRGDCGYMGVNSGKWYDYDCTNTQHVMCEE